MGEGEPLDCDFRTTKISDEMDEGVTPKAMAPGGNVRHGIPELAETNGVPATKHSDTYSFVTLMLDFITGEVPFFPLHHNASAIHPRVNVVECPPRPDGRDPRNQVSDGSRLLMTDCWNLATGP